MADRLTKEALAADALAAFPGWTLWRQSAYGAGKWQDETADHAEVWLMRVDADALHVRYLTVVTNPLSEGDSVPWEVTDYAPVPLTEEASARLSAMDPGEIFTYGSYAALSREALPGCATALLNADEHLTELVSMKEETLVGIAADDEGNYRLFVGTWDGTAYQTVTTPKQPQGIYLNNIHSNWDYIEAYSEITEFSLNMDDDGLWRISRICWYDEEDDSDHLYYLNDAWVIDSGIDEAGEWQNNDGFLYGRFASGCLMAELDLSLFPCKDIQALLDTAGFACSRMDGTALYDEPDGTLIATCYAGLTGTVAEEQDDWVCLQLGSPERGMTGWFRRDDLAFGDAVNEVICGFPSYEDWPDVEKLFPLMSRDDLLDLGLTNRHWLIGRTTEGSWLVMANQDAVVTAPADAYTGIGPAGHYRDMEWDEEDDCEDDPDCADGEYLTLDGQFAPDENGVYKDLGDYIIELNLDEADFEAARAYQDKRQGLNEGGSFEDMSVKKDPELMDASGACTACAKLNSAGEVIIGRNLDNEISVYPAFLMHTSFGRYSTISLRYNNHDTYTYDEFRESGYQDKDYMNYIAFSATDALNSEGLYVEANVREPDRYYLNSGTNPGKERVPVNMLVQMIATNCATVNEALAYLRNNINIVSTPYINAIIPTQYAYYIGDATGNFGVIEIARNEVRYIPYQPAQANYYLSPTWNAVDIMGSGYGRMEMILEGLTEVDSAEEMLEHIKKAGWYQYLLYYRNTYQDENGVTHFVDDEGNPAIDWRSDISGILPVDENGHLAPGNSDRSLSLNSDKRWMMDESNFTEMMTGIAAFMEAIGWTEKLTEYRAGNEMPLREACDVYTTGAGVAVNCAQKTMYIRFWEKDDLVYELHMH